MLNRRILRIKAFKELFAIELSTNPTLGTALEELDAALVSTRDLYLFMMGSIPALTSVAKERFALLQKKINKTEEERNPNLKFAENALAANLEADPDFKKIYRKRCEDWGAYDLILKDVYASMQTKAWFADYMANPERSLKEDCELFIHIFEEEFVDREDLAEALENLNIYWNDDLPYSLSWCCRTLDEMAKGEGWSLPYLYMSRYNSSLDDDEKFVHKLMTEAYANYDRYLSLINDSVPNWDQDRLVATDIALIATALAEIEHFPSIPTNVSINEYVEISKFFGTPNSSRFVNGLLDTLSKKLETNKNR